MPSLNQFAWVAGTTNYQFGHNSIPNIPITGAPADTNGARWAMLHDNAAYRLLHADRNASRAIVVAFANRDSHPAVADGLNRVDENAQPLVQRAGALHVDQRGVKREIVISVTQECANPPRQTGGERFEKGELVGRPPLVGGDRRGMRPHRGYAPPVRWRGTRTCAASGSTTTSNGVIPTRSPSACTGRGGSVSIRSLRPDV